MGKDKIKRFEECNTFPCMVQPTTEEVYGKEYKLKNNWRKLFFKNDNPIVLELGCGRGEYTVGLAQIYPDKNVIGIDIKGARMWRGAKTANDTNMNNVGFLRTRIEFILSSFGESEVDEIWITFPDPQLKKNRAKKRLTAPEFLRMYAKFLKPSGTVNLKTDSRFLHEYTKAVAEVNGLEVESCSHDIYHQEGDFPQELLSLKTTYEAKFLEQGMNITYIRFMLGDNKITVNPADDEEIMESY